MHVNQLTLTKHLIPEKLRHIPQPPRELFVQGGNLEELLARPCVTIVGSRKVSAYGRAVTVQMATDLARAGVTVVSGLAIGVDSIAHQAALEAGGLAIAVLPCGLDRVYPARHYYLAKQIVGRGGALVTEYKANTPIYPLNFIARNRLASGLGDVLLITEAAQKSGSLHTAHFAMEQGKDVLVIPGNITSPTSAGANNLIKSGAMPVTDVNDIFQALGLDIHKNTKAPVSSDPQEQILLNLLFSGVGDGAELLSQSKLEVPIFNQTLTMLEIRGRVRPLGNNQWALQ